MARVRLVLTSTDFLGTAVVQRCRWGLCEEFLVQLQFKWPLFTELVGFSFTEETCCSKLIHATIPRSLPLPQVFQAIQLEIYPRTKSGQQRIPGTKAYAHPCYLYRSMKKETLSHHYIFPSACKPSGCEQPIIKSVRNPNEDGRTSVEQVLIIFQKESEHERGGRLEAR